MNVNESTEKCDMCNHVKAIVRRSETVRKSGGGGSIMDLCQTCWYKLPSINKKNRI